MNQLNTVARRLSNILFGVSLVIGFLMMVHVSADVIARTVFAAPLPGAGEITASWYMVAVAFLPLGWVTLNDQHVTADIFVSRMSPRMTEVIAVLTDLLSITYVSVFVWQTWISALKQTRRGEVWEIYGGYLPVWPVRWLLPLAGAVMVLAFLTRLIARLTRDTSQGQV